MADRERDLKKLTDAVIETLIHNRRIMSLISELKERNVIDDSMLLSLYFKMDDLLEVSGAVVSQDELDSMEKRAVDELMGSGQQAAGGAEKEMNKEVIDGRDLSRNEIAFQEWASERFNEDDWLKKAGLIW